MSLCGGHPVRRPTSGSEAYLKSASASDSCYGRRISLFISIMSDQVNYSCSDVLWPVSQQLPVVHSFKYFNVYVRVKLPQVPYLRLCYERLL